MTADTPRKQIAEALETWLPGYVVDEYPNSPNQVIAGSPYVDVYATEIRNLTANQIEHGITVNVMVRAGTPAATEDQLEDARDNVLIVLTQHCPGVFVDRAERSTFMDTYAGYAITANAHSNNEYKKAEIQP
ncbi:hypothetical protein RN04_02660 [Arthrobacter sp. W1]|nr:hypothetical protein RN04_02660 [Arthrobacter sp. W1]